MTVAKKNLHFPELGFNLVGNRTFPSGISAPPGNRDAHTSRKSRKNIAFRSRISNKISDYLKKKGYFESSLKQAIFGPGTETAPGESPRPRRTLPSIPCPTPSPAPMPREKRRGSGNRCGHDPKHPNFAPPNTKRPKLIQTAIAKIQDAYTDPYVLQALNFHSWGYKVRSERREACTRVLTVILERTNLATLRVGFPTEYGFLNYSLEYLAMKTGMGLRRVARAMHDLKKIGFITVSQIRERLQDGTYRSFSAIKTVSTSLFDTLGLHGWYNKERAKARGRLWKKEKAYEKACTKSCRGISMMNRMTATIANLAQTIPVRNAGEKAQEKKAKKRQTPIIDATTGTRSIDPVSQYLNQLDPETRVLIAKRAAEITMEHPDWNREKIYEEAKRLLPGVYRSPKALPT